VGGGLVYKPRGGPEPDLGEGRGFGRGRIGNEGRQWLRTALAPTAAVPLGCIEFAGAQRGWRRGSGAGKGDGVGKVGSRANGGGRGSNAGRVG